MKTKVTTRHTLTGLALLFAVPLQAQEWSFEVYLDQQKIGTHTFSLDQNQLQSRANFKVKVLFINAYRYQHQADEQWQGNCLSQLTAHTEENKEITDVKGAIQNNKFVLDKNGSTQTLPGCIMTFAYWNPEILKQSRLLNPQNAEYLDVTVTDEGSKTIEVKGQTTLTHQYRLNGRLKGKDKLKITLWYDQQQQWVALESITPEGYKIKYKLI
ncbi:DUF6134 family protein [Methylophilus sp. VKM B-3414]|uniref:DUF6134 family protein n=1 Tax=Methylophilus sp. VKM B-3414 TaxID=3076121 RepID=UPI0028CB0365|nr:DUF6134 family protein [Methylophilus sp. VKM B-3414]MDT7850725.1 DUF6134 family protein [Methylophilus sp. VKM B-3414]